jgi:hypothetical protein
VDDISEVFVSMDSKSSSFDTFINNTSSSTTTITTTPMPSTNGLNGANNHYGSLKNLAAGTTSNQFQSCKTEWVRLNIGGKYFVTTKTTLCKSQQCFFYKLLQDDLSIGLTTDKVNNIVEFRITIKRFSYSHFFTF